MAENETMAEKSERLYLKFCKDLDVDAARIKVQLNAATWYHVQKTSVPRQSRLLAEMRLYEACEDLQRKEIQASQAAERWARSGEEPK